MCWRHCGLRGCDLTATNNDRHLFRSSANNVSELACEISRFDRVVTIDGTTNTRWFILQCAVITVCHGWQVNFRTNVTHLIGVLYHKAAFMVWTLPIYYLYVFVLLRTLYGDRQEGMTVFKYVALFETFSVICLEICDANKGYYCYYKLSDWSFQTNILHILIFERLLMPSNCCCLVKFRNFVRFRDILEHLSDTFLQSDLQ